MSLQGGSHSLGSPAGAQYHCGIALRGQHIVSKRLVKPGHIAVVTAQFTQRAVTGIADEADDVDRTHLTGVIVQRIQIRDDSLFVGGGDVKAVQIGILGDDFIQEAQVLDLEVDILGVDILGVKLLVKEVHRERVDQRVADQSIQVLVVEWRFHFL